MFVSKSNERAINNWTSFASYGPYLNIEVLFSKSINVDFLLFRSLLIVLSQCSVHDITAVRSEQPWAVQAGTRAVYSSHRKGGDD